MSEVELLISAHRARFSHMANFRTPSFTLLPRTMQDVLYFIDGTCVAEQAGNVFVTFSE